MPYDISLCDSNGNTLCGSDGNFNVDKRKNLQNIRREIVEYKERFKTNFPHKYNYWTHFIFKNKLMKI
jgi:hypothetical protein